MGGNINPPNSGLYWDCKLRMGIFGHEAIVMYKSVAIITHLCSD